ncbi:MAG TPA: hypothetical protein VN716_19070 [Vicinamibacterales bacterium]|nr:hypothetical protein [Vicinamibacterales bacterium]
MNEREGHFSQTFTGRRFYPGQPTPEDVQIEDVAHALSNLCRFGGHCLRFYSVAQHSVLVSLLVPEHLALHGLLHDAAEAYLGDVIWPVRRVIERSSPVLEQLHGLADVAVRLKFGLRDLAPHEAKELKRADLVALATERRDVMRETDHVWPILDGVAPDDEPIEPWTPRGAKTVFLDRFIELTKGGRR